MKRAISVPAILLAALLLLASCGRKNDATPDAPPESPSASTPAASDQTEPESPPDTSLEPATPAQPEKPALEQTSFKLGHLNSTAHLLGFVAAEEGFFKDEGLDAELLLFASAGELSAGLESGNLDAAFIGSVPTITFQSQEHPISVFGGAMTNGHGYVIKPELLPEDFTQGDITVLRGRNVASVKNSVQDLELQVLLTKAGLTFNQESGSDVNIVYFESQKDAFNALQGAEIDAASVYSPYASIAKNLGYAVIYYCNEIEEFINQPCCRQVALTEALEAKPATYTAFERAVIRAYKFSRENREKTIADVKKYIDIDAADIEYEVYGGHAVSHPDPDKKATVALKESVVDFGYTTDYDIEPLYNVGIYESALNSLISENPGDAVYAELLTHFNENDR
ncbi:MAG: ABC transporter substrate-binding protein [Oscillospiraceae bacterium]|jgi:NitT/TauT family transport system substrate-binding protein|nr:ABC transporter substrate-binding protein [Oscillospiraceae bacterium]